jgi:hypothetical protein
MKLLQFELKDTSSAFKKTKEITLYVKYPFKEEIVGRVKWDIQLYGYVYEQSSYGGITANILKEILQLVDDLNNRRDNKHVDKPFKF